jgi:paraquat-inducible protein B
MQNSNERQEIEQWTPVGFAYSDLDMETRAFVLEATRAIEADLKRTAEGAIQIGTQLLAVKQRLPHGQFMAWVQSEFGMSRQTCQNFMNVTRAFGDKLPTVGHLSLKVLYELATAPAGIVEQVERHELPASLPAIREAKTALKAAQEAERQARDEAKQARHTATLREQELEQTHRHAEEQQRALTEQINRLQEELTRLTTPQVVTKEVEVVPKAVEEQLEALRHKVKTLKEQRDALSQEVMELGEQARAAALQDEEEERHQRLRRGWRIQTEAVLQAVSQLLMHWPMPLDAYHFEQDEWARFSQIEEHLERLQTACHRLRETVERTITMES